MEESGSQQNLLSLPQLLTAYAEALKSLPSDFSLSSQQVLKVLRARDRVQDALSHQIARLDDDHLAKLVELDLELKQKSGAIGNAEHLGQLRQSWQPPESAWWWYFESPTEPSPRKPLSAKFDWLWNVGTVACLVLATSFMTQTAKAFSTEGFDFLGTLSTIGQGAGLAFIAGGALTAQGKQTVGRILSSVNVPSALHAEATFGASLVLLGAAYGSNQNLPLVGNWYFDQARHHEKQGEWSQAFKSYKRALNFAPDDYKNQIALGFLYERLGNFDQAIEEYKKGTAFGIPEFLNAQARAMLMGQLQKNGWQGGIDDKVVREAEDLLERANTSTRDTSRGLNELQRNKRLYADIRINQVIAKMASIKSDAKLDTKTQDNLNSIVNTLISLEELIKKDQSEQQNALTAASTLGKERAECFHQKAFVFNERLQSLVIKGIDNPVQKQFSSYDCSAFQWNTALAATPDAFLLKNYQFLGFQLSGDSLSLEVKDISSLMDFLYQSPFVDSSGFELPEYANRIALIQDSDTWLRLANQVSQLIQKNYVEYDKGNNQETVWRFLISKDGQIISYFAYDELSRARGNNQSFMEKELRRNMIGTLSNELLKGGKLEFADFKVVLTPEGKILHLIPWAMAYPIVSENCKKTCKRLTLEPRISSAFQNYIPNLKEAAELSALRAVTSMSANLIVDINKGIYYDEPAIFKLKVSSDGQIVDYQAMNQVAIQRLGKKIPAINLKIPQFPELQKPPYAEFKLEMKGIYWRYTPWSEPK